MNELALFAGAGGGILGGHLLGWRTVCAVEIEDYARRVLLARQRDGMLPRFPIWDDVTTFDGHPWRGRVDVISGGFPCQDISAAGKGAGITGERSGLWSHMARIIGEVGPRYCFVENSPLLVSRGLDVVLSDLAALGYDARWGIIGACDAGAPHKRDRIWIVADSRGQRHGTQENEVCARGNAAEHGRQVLADASGAGLSRGEQSGTLRGDGNRTQTHGPVTERSGTPGFVLQRIKYAFECSECDCCEEHWCDECGEHYADCDCLGPSEADDRGLEVVEIDGIEYARIYDTNIEGLEGADDNTESSERIHAVSGERYWWESEPDVGGMVDGLAAGLDLHGAYAAGDVGRVATRVPNRVGRLKAIGNGQVPAAAALAWKILSR